MRAERLFRVLGLVDPVLVEEALMEKAPPARHAWKRWAVLAACLTLAVSLGLGWRVTGGFRGYGSGMSGSGGASGGAAEEPRDSGAGEGGVEEGSGFLSYAGPVLPLATVEEAAGLTAERTVVWDFAPGAYPDGEPRQWGAEVTDAYVLHNDTKADITVTALYPFAGSFSELADTLPTVTVDGSEVEPVLYAGPYSGGFQSTYGAEVPDTMNLEQLDSWTKYRTLLEDGAYLEQALRPYPALDTPVTVYEFSEFEAPHEQYQAATQAISFDLDPEKTAILTYGFNGFEADGNFRRYSYFVPDGIRNEPEGKLLAVLGKDIGKYVLQGYRDGGCDRGEEIDGVACAVTRRETTLDAVLEVACRDCAGRYGEDWVSEDGPVSFAMYRGAAAELLTQYGVLSAAPKDRYADGRLDDMLAETLSQDRVLYLRFPVTVPARGSASVECGLWKAPSFDFACSGSENVGLQGYDLTTRLGSGLVFTRQSAVLANTENVDITGQNFGFDLENGVTGVELDLEQEHYYLEIRPKEE